MSNAPREASEFVEYGKNISHQHQFDIYDWMPEAILGILLAMAAILCNRILKQIDSTQSDLASFKTKTEADLSAHKTEISIIKSSLDRIESGQRETNERINSTNARLDRLIDIQCRAHGIE